MHQNIYCVVIKTLHEEEKKNNSEHLNDVWNVESNPYGDKGGNIYLRNNSNIVNENLDNFLSSKSAYRLFKESMRGMWIIKPT